MATPTPSAARTTPEPVDWGLAERVARRIAGREPLATSYLGVSLQRDFAEVTVEAEAAVTELTGLRPPSPAVAAVLDRGGWVGANVSSMRSLLAPFSDRMGARMANSPVAPVGRRIAGAELGFLLGYVAQRVLGQYDLLVPEDSSISISDDAVYYVGPNVLGLEKRFAFRPRDFRLWIALHELTHRAQFTGVPWLRGYFLGLVGELVGGVEPDPRRLLGAVVRAADEMRHGRNPIDEGGMVSLFASDEQRETLGRVQALMSLLEGHGNAVMNRLGAEMVDGQARMARVLQARRNARGATALLHRLLGLELKLKQYELGEAFVNAIEREAGLHAIDPAWQSPDLLPTLDELSAPLTWLARVDGASIATR
ncbi:MAG: zinc-dependent metalloprotease [Acidimicrobiia bacterium]